MSCTQIRGATNAVKKLLEKHQNGSTDVRVVAQSSGNHAQALSLAASSCGIPAHIVMPSNSPPVKVQAVKGYGGIVTLCHPSEKVHDSSYMVLYFSGMKRLSFQKLN